MSPQGLRLPAPERRTRGRQYRVEPWERFPGEPARYTVLVWMTGKRGAKRRLISAGELVTVDAAGWRCTCGASGRACDHRDAVQRYRAGTLPAVGDMEPVAPSARRRCATVGCRGFPRAGRDLCRYCHQRREG